MARSSKSRNAQTESLLWQAKQLKKYLDQNDFAQNLSFSQEAIAFINRADSFQHLLATATEPPETQAATQAQPAPTLKMYRLTDEFGVEGFIQAADIDGAKEAAEEWLMDGDNDTSEGPLFLSANIYEYDPRSFDFDPQATEGVMLALDQDEPPCEEDENHEWTSEYRIVRGTKENPGVFGKGGGVTINEACIHCGCQRTTDTWYQIPDSGQIYTDGVLLYTPDHYDTYSCVRCEKKHLDECNELCEDCNSLYMGEWNDDVMCECDGEPDTYRHMDDYRCTVCDCIVEDED